MSSAIHAAYDRALKKKRYFLILLAVGASVLFGILFWANDSSFSLLKEPQKHSPTSPTIVPSSQSAQTPTPQQADAASPSTERQSKQNKPVRQGLVVVLKPGFTIQAHGPLAKYLAMPEVIHSRLEHLNMVTLFFPQSWDLVSIQKEINDDPAVAFSGQNIPLQMHQTTPNDPLFPREAFYTLKDGPGGINAQQAWRYTTGDKSVIIAVFDSGIDYTHPDLKDNIWVNEAELNGLPNVDDDHPEGPVPCRRLARTSLPANELQTHKLNVFCDDIHGTAIVLPVVSNDPQDLDIIDSHGTGVSSIIAASGNNAAFHTGVAWKATLLGVTVFDLQGSTGTLGLLTAINYVLEMKLKRGVNIRAIQFSGGLLRTDTDSPLVELMQIALLKLEQADVLFINSAGNEAMLIDDSSRLPHGLIAPNLLVVASHDSDGNIASDSNFGPRVHLAAPGVRTPLLQGRLFHAYTQLAPLRRFDGIFSTTDFTAWIPEPPGTWSTQSLVTQEGFAQVPYYENSGFHISTTFTHQDPIDLSNQPDGVAVIANIRHFLETDSSLTIQAQTGTQSNWISLGSWSGDSTIFNIPLTFSYTMLLSDAFTQNNFRIRLRAFFPKVGETNRIRFDSLTFLPYTPIPQYADIPEAEKLNYISFRGGTSFAAPHVSGVAALIWAQRPELSAVEVHRVITNPENLDPFPCMKANVPCTSTGGRLNAFKILTAITTPDISITGPGDLITQPDQSYLFSIRLQRAPGVFTTSDRVVFRATMTYQVGARTIVQNTSLSFTTDNWDQAQHISLSTNPLSDSLIIPDSDERTTALLRLTASDDIGSDSDFAGVTKEKHFCIQSNRQPRLLGFCNVNLVEGGVSDYHLSLSQRPAKTLTASIVVAQGSDITVTPRQMMFTPDNWNTTQTLTIRSGTVHLLDDQPRQSLIRIRLADSSESTTRLITETVTVVSTRSSPTIVFEPQDQVHLSGFSARTVSVRLGGQPASDVRINLSNSHAELLGISPETLSFTTNSWNKPQTMTLQVKQSATTSATLTAQVDNSTSDRQYHSVITMLPILIDARALHITGLDSQSIQEGMPHTYELRLSATPNQTLHIDPTADPAGLLVFSPQQITLTQSDWHIPHKLQIDAPADLYNRQTRHTLISLIDPSHHLEHSATATVTILDNNVLPDPDLVVQPPAKIPISLGSHPTHISVHLSTTPTSNIVLRTANTLSKINSTPETLIFTPANWNIPQNIAFTSLPGLNPEDFYLRTSFFAFLILSSSDPQYPQFDLLPETDLIFQLLPQQLLGFGDQHLTEGQKKTYLLRLAQPPEQTLTLTPLTRPANALNFEPPSLIFTPHSGDEPQEWTVQAPRDLLNSQTRTVSIAIADSPAQLARIPAATVAIDDNGQTASLISTPDTSLSFDKPAPQNLQVQLAGQPHSTVVLTLRIDDGRFVMTPTRLTFTSNNWNQAQRVSIHPPSQKGTHIDTKLTITVNNAHSDAPFHNIVKELKVTVRSGLRFRFRILLEGSLQ